MTIKDPAKWNMRASLVYAIGIWGAIGSYAVLRYTGLVGDFPVIQEEVQEEENPNKVTYTTAHSKTVIIYKKDFVPYTTRLYNYICSFSSQPGSQDSDK